MRPVFALHPSKADLHLSANYGGAWHCVKTEIIPELINDIEQHRSHEQNMLAPAKQSFDQRKSMKNNPVKENAKIEAQKHALRYLRQKFGNDVIKGTRFDNAGNLDIKVPKGYSRSNFERMGIRHTHQLNRQHHDQNNAVITIPQSQLPLSIRFEAKSTPMQQPRSPMRNREQNNFAPQRRTSVKSKLKLGISA